MQGLKVGTRDMLPYLHYCILWIQLHLYKLMHNMSATTVLILRNSFYQDFLNCNKTCEKTVLHTLIIAFIE